MRAGVADVSMMQMPCEEKIDLVSDEYGESQRRASHEIDSRAIGRRDERVMRYDHFKTRAGVREPVIEILELVQRDAAIFPRERAGGVQTDDKQVGVFVQGILVSGDVTMVAAEWRQEAPDYVVERDVVIARDNETRERQLIQKFSGFGKLGASGALGKIAAHNHQRRSQSVKIAPKRLGDQGQMRAEMKIGEVGDSRHGDPGFRAGTRTCNAFGRMRK